MDTQQDELPNELNPSASVVAAPMHSSEEIMQMQPEAADLTSSSEAIRNSRIISKDVDPSDGINTETEIFASEAGGLALGGESPPFDVVAGDVKEQITDAPGVSVEENEEWELYTPEQLEEQTREETERQEKLAKYEQEAQERRAQKAKDNERIEKEQVERSRAYENLPDIAKEAMDFTDKFGHRKYFDPVKVEKLMPIIEVLDVGEKEELREEDQKLIFDLALMAHCEEDQSYMSDEKKELEVKKGQEFLDFTQKIMEKGVSARGLVELVRTQENMDTIIDLHKQNPDSLGDETSSLGLILRMANLPLYSLAPEDKEYYTNGQGRQADVRDSVIATIIEAADQAEFAENPDTQESYQQELDGYAQYITELEEKVPALQQTDFPLDKIGKILLTKFNPSIRINIYDDNYETKIMDRCMQVGGRMRELESIDSSLAHQVVHGENDLSEVIDLAGKIDKVKSEEPEAYKIFDDFKKMRIFKGSHLPNVVHYLKLARGIANSPELYKLVEEEEVREDGGLIYLAKNTKMLADMNRWERDSDKLDEFFENCHSLRDLISDERISTEDMLSAAGLDAEQLETFMGIMNSSDVQLAYDDPEAADHLNRSMFWIKQSMNPELITKSLGLFKSLDKKAHFPLYSIIRNAHELSKHSSYGETVDTSAFLDTVKKASKMIDKNGFPYDSIESVATALKFLERESKKYKDPEAVKKEMLGWFESSGLPYAALQPVVKIAEEAERQGVAFEPMAVYKWMFEDEQRIKETSRENLKDYLSLRKNISLKVDEEKTEEVIAEAKKEISERAESFRVLMNIKQNVLQNSVANSGELQSMFDEVEMTERGADYELYRSGVEIALGIRSLDEAEEHRVYGTCAFIDKGVPTGAEGYGDIVLVFKPDDELLASTTYTPEDSFHGADRLTMEDAQIVRYLKDKEGIGHGEPKGLFGSLATSEYVEAQIPGEVTLQDVEQIVARNEQQAQELREQLPAGLAEKVVAREA